MASIKRWLVGEPVSAARLAQIRAQLAAQTGAPSRRAALTGGAVIVGSSMAGMGGQSPAPLNAPPSGSATPGVQPGTSNGIVAAIILIIQAILPGSGAFVYSAAAAVGDLIASITAANGTDLKGNTTYAGIASYLANGTANPSSVVQLFAGQINIGAGFQFAALGGSSPAALTVTAAQSSGSAAQINSGEDATGSDAPAALTVQSSDATGGSSTVGTVATNVPILLGDTAPPPASNKVTAIYADTSSIPRTLNANDGNVCAVGHIMAGSAAASQVVNSLTPAVVTGSSVKVGVGKYRLNLRLICTSSAGAGAADFSWGGTSTVGHVDGIINIQGAGGVFASGYIDGSFANFVTGTLPGGGAHFYVWIEADLNVSVAGTVLLNAACSVAADTYTIKSCYALLTPW